MIRVLLADDHAMVRAGFRRLLEMEGGFSVVAEAPDGRAAVEAARRTHPDVALLDIRMPVMDGIEATRRIVADAPTRVVILTTFDLDEYVYDALRAGASGFLLKDAPPEQLLAAVQVAFEGDALIAPPVTKRLLDEFVRRPDPGAGEESIKDLTAREREVLLCLARGLSNAEIAAELYLGEATVKSHVAAVLSKLGLRDRVQSVVFAYESGLVRPGNARST